VHANIIVDRGFTVIRLATSAVPRNLILPSGRTGHLPEAIHQDMMILTLHCFLLQIQIPTMFDRVRFKIIVVMLTLSLCYTTTKGDNELRLEVSALNNRLQQLEKIVLLQNDRITNLEKSNKDLERIVLEKSERVDQLENVVKKLQTHAMPLGVDGNMKIMESNTTGPVVKTISDDLNVRSAGNLKRRQLMNRQGMI
jgi:exonuclease VII small subunit